MPTDPGRTIVRGRSLDVRGDATEVRAWERSAQKRRRGPPLRMLMRAPRLDLPPDAGSGHLRLALDPASPPPAALGRRPATRTHVRACPARYLRQHRVSRATNCPGYCILPMAAAVFLRVV